MCVCEMKIMYRVQKAEKCHDHNIPSIEGDCFEKYLYDPIINSLLYSSNDYKTMIYIMF